MKKVVVYKTMMMAAICWSLFCQQLHSDWTSFRAGGGHITLAAAAGQVVYATWVDREGDNVGRVDVVGIGSNADDSQGNPKRTGAFENAGSQVLFTVGRGEAPELCMLNAASPKPALTKLGLSVAKGNTLATPKAVQLRTGEQFALLFEESQSGEQPEKLHVVSVDPNGDGNFSDASVRTSLPVGRSLIEGHSGHHEAAALGRALMAISNPGDKSIAIISTSDWTVQTTLKVGGTPTRIFAVGG